MKNKQQKLTFSALPMFAHGKNLRSVSPYHWKGVRQGLLKEKGCCCEICGATPLNEKDQRNFHGHEEWEFDLENHVLILKDIRVICHLCHQTDHIGLLQLKLKDGRITKEQYNQVFQHYADVNGITFQQAKTDYLKSSLEWIKRQNEYDPTLNHAEWKYRLDCNFPNKDKIEKTLKEKDLLFEERGDQ